LNPSNIFIYLLQLTHYYWMFATNWCDLFVFQIQGPLWSWSYTTTCAIIVYHHLCCEFEFRSCGGALDTTLCD